jgi:transposase-like protein/IS1 family transposase
MCTHARNKKCGSTKAGTQRFKCLDCGKKFTDGTRQLNGMRIGVDRSAQIIRSLMEGLSVRATARLCGVDQHTVLDLLVLVGGRCKRFSEATLVDVPVNDVEADELWSFVGCKEKTRKRLSLPFRHFGDQYCFIGLERTTKLALAWHLGQREPGNGQYFVEKLTRACWKQPFQITTDGWLAYKALVRWNMPHAHYGVLIKIYGPSQDTVRYSPAQIIETKRKVIMGNPDPERMCTSMVERHNLSIRMYMRRFTRLTNGFSKKMANHEAALGLYFAHYNWVKRHGTLGTTPAVASGVADRQWTVEELVERTAGYREPNQFETLLAQLPDSDDSPDYIPPEPKRLTMDDVVPDDDESLEG